MGIRPPSVPLWQWSAAELAAAYAQGTLSPTEALEATIARTHQVQPRINALVALDLDGARAMAAASTARWHRAAPLSPLDGVPITVKDNIPVAGLPCRWGSRLYADYVPAQDEQPVARLRSAGAVLMGKTNVPEFTLQGYTDNPLAGPTRNPWDLMLTPGGSSGGAAAAVAAGIGPLALGTDGGGSIRRPASHTGLVGLKPSWGTVPRAHGLPEILPGMEVVGPLVRTVEDAACTMHVLSGLAPLPTPTRPWRIAYWRHVGDGPVDPEVLHSVDTAAALFAGLGHAVTEQDAPVCVDEFNQDAWPVLSATGLAAVLRDRPDAPGLLTPALRTMLEHGQQLRATDLFEAQRLVRALRSRLDGLWGRYDCILTPSAAALPWPAAESHPPVIDHRAAGPRGHAVFTAFANAAGLPALALPATPSRQGLPIGLQLVGPHGTDAALLSLGAQLEREQPWRHRWPKLD